MDLWSKARVFAEEAAKRSQEISKEAAKRSQELTKGAARFSQEFVSDAAKRSRELAAEASRKADEIRSEALRAADQIKSLAVDISSSSQPPQDQQRKEGSDSDLELFGVTGELREFVKGITLSTFRDFPLQDEPETSDVATISNVRQDLNEWRARHATLVLSTVQEISKFRYELCPRNMKERKFWRIYFILVNHYVAPYEKQYMEELSRKSTEQKHNDQEEDSAAVPSSKVEMKDTKLQSKNSTSSTAEQDLDVFLLGDLGSSDEGADDGDDGFDDDFDKIENTSGLESEDDERKSKQSDEELSQQQVIFHATLERLISILTPQT